MNSLNTYLKDKKITFEIIQDKIVVFIYYTSEDLLVSNCISIELNNSNKVSFNNNRNNEHAKLLINTFNNDFIGFKIISPNELNVMFKGNQLNIFR